jgi:hypothetical protein
MDWGVCSLADLQQGMKQGSAGHAAMNRARTRATMTAPSPRVFIHAGGHMQA